MDQAKKIFQEKLGERISLLRERSGLTQTELGIRCNKDRQSINRLEKGNVNPSSYYLLEISRALDISLSELVRIEI
jgi:putative transcriptional regulator